jgi:hypothetical protein
MISLTRRQFGLAAMAATITMAAPTLSTSTHQRRGLLPSAESTAIWILSLHQGNGSGQRMFPIATRTQSHLHGPVLRLSFGAVRSDSRSRFPPKRFRGLDDFGIPAETARQA